MVSYRLYLWRYKYNKPNTAKICYLPAINYQYPGVGISTAQIYDMYKILGGTLYQSK